MIVEDEPDIATILREVLAPLYEVVAAANGLEALDRIGRYEPDITIMDLMMPILDGFDTTRAIKKDQRFSHMPVLFLTARKDNDAVRNALLAGGDIYLEKPFSPPELITRIAEIVARNRVMPRRNSIACPRLTRILVRRPRMPRPDSRRGPLRRLACVPNAHSRNNYKPRLQSPVCACSPSMTTWMF